MVNSTVTVHSSPDVSSLACRAGASLYSKGSSRRWPSNRRVRNVSDLETGQEWKSADELKAVKLLRFEKPP